MGKRAYILHYKDLKPLSDNAVECSEIGEGSLPRKEIVKASRKAKYAVIEQDICHGDPVDSLARSYKYLTENFGFI